MFEFAAIEFFGLNSTSNTVMFSVLFVTGRPIMTVFPFEYFLLVLDKIRQLPKQYSVVVLGDFNARYDSTNPSGIAM